MYSKTHHIPDNANEVHHRLHILNDEGMILAIIRCHQISKEMTILELHMAHGTSECQRRVLENSIGLEGWAVDESRCHRSDDIPVMAYMVDGLDYFMALGERFEENDFDYHYVDNNEVIWQTMTI